MKRPRSYYLVVGVDLLAEMRRLSALSVFAGGPLAEREAQLKVRRASRRPNRVGFAVPDDFRLSVTAYPDIRPGDVLETLLHELCHLHVGRGRGANAWHGRAFKETLRRAMHEAYGVTGVCAGGRLHGPYAEAIEQRRLARGEQLPLELAA